jgi:hypothetical protein
VVRIVRVQIVGVMRTRVRAAPADRVHVRLIVLPLAVMRHTAQLWLNRVAVRRENALLIKNKIDHRF